MRCRLVAAAVAVAAVVAPFGNAGAAGQVAKYGRSHTHGDFDGDGTLDRAFGCPRASDDRGTERGEQDDARDVPSGGRAALF